MIFYEKDYAIEKINDSLSRVVFKPGEELSVNDHVGSGIQATGWALSTGIGNTQPGIMIL